MSTDEHKMQTDDAKALVTATKFLQAEIAKYLGNDGKLSEEENKELEYLRDQFKIDGKNFERLKKLAEKELFYFRRDDVVGYVLGRVDRSKLYLDAEKISVRISLVDRWIQELETIRDCLPKDLSEENKKESTKKILGWIYKEDESPKSDELALKDAEELISRIGKEKKDAPDDKKHWGALICYIIAIAAAIVLLYWYQFSDLELIYSDDLKYSTVIDYRDSSQYKYIKIGDISWMAANLKYATPNSIPVEFRTKNSGRHYSWNEAIQACPTGWRLPTQSEWKALIDEAGGDSIASKSLKSKGTWNNEGNGDNSLGFSALPTGHTTKQNKAPHNLGDFGMWWTYSMTDAQHAMAVRINANNDSIFFVPYGLDYSISIRCVKIDNKNIPYQNYPDVEPPKSTQIIKGSIDSYNDSNSIPTIRLANKKKISLFNSETLKKDFYKKIIPIRDSSILGNRLPASPQSLFIQGSSITIHRHFNRTYSLGNDVWKQDSIWQQDSILISGKFNLLDINSLSEKECNATFEAISSNDSLTTITINRPCSALQIGQPYSVSVEFILDKSEQWNDERFSINDKINYKIIKSEILQQPDEAGK